MSFDRGVAVIGLGYIGLPTSAAIAMQGVRVVGVDIDPEVVAAVGRGEVPFVEPDLDVAVAGAVQKGLLEASSTVPQVDAYIIAVPTPFDSAKTPDLSHVRSAVEAIGPKLTRGAVVILESTSPPGTTAAIGRWLADLRPDLRMPGSGQSDPDVHIAHCPERVLPGRIMIEIIANDRVVGGLTPSCAEAAAELYRTFCKGEILLTDAVSAEMAKLVENSFRDVNIAFANELATICESLSVDVWEIIRLANRHPRVNVLQPGPGVGGHCIAVDPWFIIAASPQNANLIREARRVNDARPAAVLARAAEMFGDTGGPVACLGLAFKANVDDLRESPAVDIVAQFAAQSGREVLVVEPHVTKMPSRLESLPNVHLSTLDDALAGADCVMLLVDHDQFKNLDPSRLVGKKLVDTRGIWRRSS